MSEVKIVRMSTGEDVISTVDKDSVGNYTMKKPFVIVPTQSAPGQPVKLMLTPYMPYAEEDKITISADKVVTSVKPKKDMLVDLTTSFIFLHNFSSPDKTLEKLLTDKLI